MKKLFTKIYNIKASDETLAVIIFLILFGLLLMFAMEQNANDIPTEPTQKLDKYKERYHECNPDPFWGGCFP